MIRARSFFFAVTVVLAVPGAAHAQTGVASQLFDTGRDLMKRGDFAAACPKLAESVRLEPRVGTFARLAECEEQIGHLAAARGHWKDAVDLARAQKDARLAHAQDELKRVEAIVPMVVLHLAGPPPPGFAVQIDALSVGAESLGVALPVDPGPHAVAAGATGKLEWKTTVETRAGSGSTTVEIPALADQPTPPVEARHELTTPASPTVPAEHVHRPLAPIGLALGIAGVVIAGTGLGFGVAAQSARDQAFNEGCQGNGICFAGTAADDYSKAHTFAALATVGLLAGTALAAAGAVLFLVAPKKVERTTALWITPGGVGGTW